MAGLRLYSKLGSGLMPPISQVLCHAIFADRVA
jgi:hypothetical protein